MGVDDAANRTVYLRAQEVLIYQDYSDVSSKPTDYANWRDIVDSANAFSGKSDARIKKDIEQYESNYEIFFDKLKPCKYKYVDGTSDRYHTGYIA
jgi:hypothetical protein